MAAQAVAATPILASSLLAGPAPSLSARSSTPKGWDLKPDLFGNPDADGPIIGKGGVLGISGYLDADNNGNGNSDDVGDLALQILLSFLLQNENRRAFIIHPAHSPTFSPERMLSRLLSMTDGGSDSDSDSELLSRVEILRVFDFVEMGQAVGEVSERVVSDMDRGEGEGDGDVLVVVEGVDKFTKSVIEKSDVGRGNALLGGVLRRLGVLARGGKGRVLVVNGGVGVGGYGSGGGNGARTPVVERSAALRSRAGGDVAAEGSGAEGKAGISTETEGEDTDDITGEEEEEGAEKEATAIEPHPPPQQHQQSKYQRQNQHQSSIFLENHNSRRPARWYLAFNKSLDQGIDTHLLVSRVQGERIVEVAKDRIGDGVGRWCVWG